ncbi:MAG: rRNA maturation RNase YbeY [Succinivibrionaceae bacterium]|nr:rRNA maturation RNase YbeY [Succinivibrionaceae bacterium]
MSVEVDLQVALGNQDEYEFDARALGIPTREDFVRIATAAVEDYQKQAEITVRIVTEEESRELDRRYREKDRPTNVLSFPYEYPEGFPEPELPLLGDLVICKAVVEREAREQGKELMHHYSHMVVHGCLHLLGFDHITDQEAEEMETAEKRIMTQKLHLPDPYLKDEE